MARPCRLGTAAQASPQNDPLHERRYSRALVVGQEQRHMVSLAHELSGLGSTRVVRFHASAGRRINEPDDMATGPQDGQIL